MSVTINVVSYNVLSSSLSSPNYFHTCSPKDCDPDTRFKRLLVKLEKVMPNSSIICLQEVSREWCGRLHVFFARNKYRFITSLYGSQKTGYMGIGIAYPDHMELIDCRIERIMDVIPLVRQEVGWWEWATGKRYEMLDFKNTIMFLRFQKFTVATLHMPCEFKRPEVMTMLAQSVVEKTKNERPLVLCGDFNIRPFVSEAYEILSKKYQSAYGTLPQYTCLAIVGNAPQFKDTLDYIWLSRGDWLTTNVIPVPFTKAKSFPCETEPSDHVMIGAELVMAY